MLFRVLCGFVCLGAGGRCSSLRLLTVRIRCVSFVTLAGDPVMRNVSLTEITERAGGVECWLTVAS